MAELEINEEALMLGLHFRSMSSRQLYSPFLASKQNDLERTKGLFFHFASQSGPGTDNPEQLWLLSRNNWPTAPGSTNSEGWMLCVRTSWTVKGKAWRNHILYLASRCKHTAAFSTFPWYYRLVMPHKWCQCKSDRSILIKKDNDFIGMLHIPSQE